MMVAYQRGEVEGFEALYAALAGTLRGYLATLVRDSQRAADLVQDTFLQIHRSRHVYRPELPVRPWVFAIARHVGLMDLRARSRRPGDDAELHDIPVPPEAERLGDRVALSRALAQLPADRREALLLHHVWGFSFQEIAQLLGITVTAAKLRSSRGMADLRRDLER